MSPRFMLPTALVLTAFIVSPVLAQTSTSPVGSNPSAATNAHSSMAPGAMAPKSGEMAPGTMAPKSGEMNAPMGSANSTSMHSANRTGTYMTANDQMRASKLIGSDVYNDQKEEVGSIDELLVNKNHQVVSAILSVGGFLGIDSKLVKIPYKELHITKNRIMLMQATKAELKKMPSYSFGKAG